jgi:hypothetical protein
VVGSAEEWPGEVQAGDPAWLDVPGVVEPDEGEYYAALEEGIAADREKEKQLRILAWWRRNNPYRGALDKDAGTTPIVSAECEANLDGLLKLLDHEDEQDRIMKAEVLRELGRFGPATQVLSDWTAEPYGWVVAQVLALCDAEDSCVRQLRFPERRAPAERRRAKAKTPPGKRPRR